ncbi:multicopper oxidase domain-containing protein [Riemerella columbipharyngis]|uniref:Copper-resistance protein, CopA family n=1 Tax=Riemerella columbipharyngis TaxID=1071918 RepID=A0A1G7DFK7_9FLAO|nr:multicopper oxidase domain-containing protein [Riemerella columbipharyngis]SDE50239.1 copper-resistance protein, CopA family [Riemerella columbipharyngis]
MKIFKLVFCLLWSVVAFAQSSPSKPVKEYTLTITKGQINKAGVHTNGMMVNGSVPGPTLVFNEGDSAVIHVENKMSVPTSVHWHGLLLPNYEDGVPILTTPPIAPHSTYTYHIPLRQSGTYWYHSHTMLQEQKGVYGSIVILPKQKSMDYDKDLVIVLSDWTNERPEAILKNLKRGNEWYQIKKGTAVPLSQVISRGALGAQLKMWRDRMEAPDIADVYYPAFLTNGKKTAEYPDLKPGEKVRLRFINASASTYFWLDFGKANPLLISADGIDVQPVRKNRLLMAIAETYDFIVQIPDGKLEISATAQDGSGHTLLHLGSGKLIPASIIDKPDKIEMMKAISEMDMKMGAPALAWNPKKAEPKKQMEHYGMKMSHDNHSRMDMHHDMMMPTDEHKEHKEHGHSHDMHQMSMHSHTNMSASEVFTPQEREKYFNYDFLKAQVPSVFDKNLPVNHILLNLTGNMERYVWSMNGVPISEADEITIKKGVITRITLNNLTMMHHPMHLHGHYFRVISKNGDYSPWKHTVNIPPMHKLTIELVGDESGDWFFHCHVLYHMMSGMTRIFTYNTPRDVRLPYDKTKIKTEMDPYFSWGTLATGSNYSSINWTYSSIRNEWDISAEADYRGRFEAELSYNRYLNDWVRTYLGVKSEKYNIGKDYQESSPVLKAGLKYFTPYRFYTDISIDSRWRPSFKVGRELLLFPRLFFNASYEYTADFGWTKSSGKKYTGETKWELGMEYMLSRDFSLAASYHNLYKWGGGLVLRL